MQLLAISMLGLATLVDEPVPSALLPKTPADWRFERIEFPLTFAPNIKYEGFEELRFTPGMFNAKSDTYFTYIFAMQIKEDVKWDAATLKELLENYYRGLCRTVAKDTEFKIDEEKIVADVKEEHFEAPKSQRFRVSLACYDPFVTGKPLKLNIALLTVDKGNGIDHLFATVSPRPWSDPIWIVLLQLEKDFRKKSSQGKER